MNIDPKILAEADQSIAAAAAGLNKLMATDRQLEADGHDRTLRVAALTMSASVMLFLGPDYIARGLAVALVRLREAEDELARLKAGGQ